MRQSCQRVVAIVTMVMISNQVVSSELIGLTNDQFNYNSQYDEQSTNILMTKQSKALENHRSQQLYCAYDGHFHLPGAIIDTMVNSNPNLSDLRRFHSLGSDGSRFSITDKIIECSPPSVNGDVLLRAVWPIVFLLYALLCLFLFGSDKGRRWRKSDRKSSGRKRNLTKRANEPILSINIEATELSKLSRAKFRPWEGDDASMISCIDDLPVAKGGLGRCTGLAIKTRRFCVNERLNGSSNEEYQCTICMDTLQDGDRVGSMHCHHVFHADCLKAWLQRRNLCPLCKSPHVTTPFSCPR
jgi:Ring finger domain